VLAVVIGHTLLIANSGDCEAILASAHPCPAYRLLTMKHKPTLPSERERIERLGGTVLYGRVFGDLAVSRSLGDAVYKRPFLEEDIITCMPHLLRIELSPEDGFLLMACDGLWDKYSYSEAVTLVAKLRMQGLSPTQISQTIAADAIERGSKDNVTALIVFFNWEETKRIELEPAQIVLENHELSGWVRASINLGSATEEFGASLRTADTWMTAPKGGLSKWKEKRAGTNFAVDK